MTPRALAALRPLIGTQFLGAFNDNAWKYLVTLLSLQAVEQSLGEDAPGLEVARQGRTALAIVAYTLPLMVASLPAVALADRFGKKQLIVATKVLELVLLSAGTCALFLDPAGHTALLVLLGLLGVQSAFFSPAKYGILPEILPHELLSRGNGQLELFTFLAIVTGTAAGGILLGATGAQIWIAGAVLLVLSIVGLLLSLRIPAGAVALPTGEGAFRRSLAAIRQDRILRLAVVGTVYFWVLATVLGQNVLVFSSKLLAGQAGAEMLAALPLAVLGVGVGVGCWLAGRLSGDKVEYGLLPLGSLGLAAVTLLVGVVEPDFVTLNVLLGLAGISSGCLVVPLNALHQWRAPRRCCGGVIAWSNFFVFGGVIFGSGLTYALASAGLPAERLFLVGGLLTLGGTVWAVALLPEAFLRLILFLLTHTFYRVRTLGRTHVPVEGGALLVPNHVSFVDGLFLLATIDRPVRFLIERSYYEHPLFHRFLKVLHAIPISSEGGPRQILRALRQAGEYLEAGDLVCIFAEGQITRTGMLLPFRRGLERIVKGRSQPVVPVYLDRVWGSIFSRSGGRFLTKIPQSLPYPVTVAFGPPMAGERGLGAIRQAVEDLGQQAWEARKKARRPLHYLLVRAARRGPLRFAMADHQRRRVSYGQALVGTIALAEKLRPAWHGQARVGILLPPSVPAALVNYAASLSGKVSVNLNYTTGPAGMASAIRQAELRTVVTSREFLTKASLALPDDLVVHDLGELSARVTRGDRLAAFLRGWLLPVRALERRFGAARPIDTEDDATIIFSSGSTGEPKGVRLTHANIDANVTGVAQVARIQPTDRLLGILPLFHSFGMFMLWFATSQRAGVVYHPNPLDALVIGDLVQRFRLTIVLATPTFLQMYLRRCTPAQFGSVRILLAGAEKLPERLTAAFEQQFGIRPLEGYGATECSPVVAVSVPDFRAPGFFQPGSKRGSVGVPLPGISLRIVDPDSGAERQVGEAGMLHVKGPGVMRGYLGREDLTQQVIRDGWYVTGDIAFRDEEGFLFITDRLSRFSKIGGEMVPHGKVEEALHEAAGRREPTFAVTGIPDARKGERLAVLSTLPPEEIPEILERLAETGLPNLFRPRPDQFVHVEALPFLGTGKLDLQRVKMLAQQGLAAP